MKYPSDHDFFIPLDTEIQGLKVVGRSLAGVATGLNFPQLDVNFDVGAAHPEFMTASQIFLSHGHSDHAGGIPYILAQRALNKMNPAKIWAPEKLVGPLSEIIKNWEHIEEHNYSYVLSGLKPLDQVVLQNPNFFIRCFLTTHRIPSLGYTIFKIKKSLKPEWLGKSQDEIIQAKKAGHVIEQVTELPLISYTGDTKIEVLESCDWLLSSRALFIEVSYFENSKAVAEARHWGHIHWDELRPRLDEIRSEQIILIHPSRRYNREKINDVLNRTVTEEQKKRLFVFAF